MLSPYRVLDLTNERGLLCGQILADLGADVVQVEPPGGSSARSIGPFYEGREEPDRSLYWWAFARNKRGVTLDVARPEGRELLVRLAATADFLIESELPGVMASHGLGYGDLAAANPNLIYVSISPYGQDGPKAGWAESDLAVLAAGGALALIGDDDRAPVRVSVPQAYLHAGAEAAVGALIALFGRQQSGRGQHVDVSAQLAVNQTTFSSSLAAATNFPPPRRLSGGVRYGRTPLQQVYPTKDGFVAITLLFGNAIGPYTKKLFGYIHEQGLCDEALRDTDWITYGDGLLTGKISDEEFDRVKQTVRDFTLTRTKAELFSTAFERGLLIAPITRIDEVLASEQLGDRGYWVELEHPEIGKSFRYPGPFAKFGDSPLAYRRRAPTVGEHNREVYVDGLGLAEDELLKLQRNGVV